MGRRSLVNNVDVFGTGASRVVEILDCSGKSKGKPFIIMLAVAMVSGSEYGPPIAFPMDGANRCAFKRIEELCDVDYKDVKASARANPTFLIWCIGLLVRCAVGRAGGRAVCRSIMPQSLSPRTPDFMLLAVCRPQHESAAEAPVQQDTCAASSCQ